MKKHKKLIITLIVIALVISIAVFFVIKNKGLNRFEEPQGGMEQFMKDDSIKDKMDMGDMENKSDKKVNANEVTLKQTAEVESALTEKVELHATYYLEEVYVEENDFVEAGENILKYTNGTYLVAPYDCYVIGLNLPDLEGKILNSHYVEISSSNSLMVTMSVDETNIANINVGLDATIEITALGKTYTGSVTHVASTGNNGNFEIEIEFENDGDVLIGMTGEVSITF
jgi:hypothetical protein